MTTDASSQENNSCTACEKLDQLGQKNLHLQTELEKVESHFRQLMNDAPVMIWLAGTDSLCFWFNQGWLQFTGRTLEQEMGNGWAAGVHPDDFQDCLDTYLAAFAARQPFRMEYRLRRHDGEYRWILDNGSPRHDEQGVFLGYIGSCIDIHLLKTTQERLELAAGVFDHASEAIVTTTPDGTIVDVNAAFTTITGYAREEVLGKNPRILSSGRQDATFYAGMWRSLLTKGHWYGEIWNRRKSGEVYAELLTITAVRDAGGRIQNYIGMFSDITAYKEQQRLLEHLAHYDPLTHLPNRVLLVDRLKQDMIRSQRHNRPLAVISLDLDGFKSINDSHGHGTGDRLLIALAERMKHALRESDTLARIGGDEFIIVLSDLSDIATCYPLLDHQLATVSEPVDIDGLKFHVSASLGVTFYPQNKMVDADQLLRQAGLALYQAKLAGGNRYSVFDTTHDRHLRDQHEIRSRIRQALDRNEFVLHYQPKVDMRRGQVIGAEALIRWQHPERGLLPPADFLPAIENHPLSIVLGDWVIETALHQIEVWQAAGLSLPVSVNVSAEQLRQSHFLARLTTQLTNHPTVSPAMLELEILETSALENFEQVSAVIDGCHRLGVKWALDDFGTGYSSLAYLKRLAVDQIKIDQSFIRGMLADADDLAILEGVLGLAFAFRREAIAEGVESEEHGKRLLQLGCELGQGYGIARPMLAADIPAWIGRWHPPATWSACVSLRRTHLPLLFGSVDHRAWMAALASHFKNAAAPLPPLDHCRCRLGHWLNSAGRSDLSPSEHAEIAALHHQVHQLAEEVIGQSAAHPGPANRASFADLEAASSALLTRLETLIESKSQRRQDAD